MSLVIRPATPDDFAAMLALWSVKAADSASEFSSWTDAITTDDLTAAVDSELSILLAAYDGDTLTGFGFFPNALPTVPVASDSATFYALLRAWSNLDEVQDYRAALKINAKASGEHTLIAALGLPLIEYDHTIAEDGTRTLAFYWLTAALDDFQSALTGLGY